MSAIAWEHLPQPPRRVPLRLAPAPPARRRPPATVVRRRRLLALAVLFVVVVSLVLVARTAVSVATGSATAGDPVVESRVLVARPGDSYWSLAEQVHEAGDLRATVDALVAANGGRDLHPGDRIVLE